MLCLEGISEWWGGDISGRGLAGWVVRNLRGSEWGLKEICMCLPAGRGYQCAQVCGEWCEFGMERRRGLSGGLQGCWVELCSDFEC